jgi:hypothetical protein
VPLRPLTEKWAFDLASKCKTNAMDRRAFLKGAAGDPRRLASEALPLSHLPGFVDAAVAQTEAPQKRAPFWGPRCDARRSGAFQNAWRLGDSSVQHAPLSAPLLMTDPGDLVERALLILAEEDEAWQARRGLNLSPRSNR